MTTDLCHTLVESPVGPLLLVAGPRGLRQLRFARGRPVESPRGARKDDGAFAAVRAQLDEYFAGARYAFDLALDLEGTPFQRDVWAALLEIPYGRTASYGDIARRIGRPQAVRAVGLANGSNPIAIVVPCHRVIGANGSLTGYGGGLERKEWLLALERGAAPRAAHQPTLLPQDGDTPAPVASRR